MDNADQDLPTRRIGVVNGRGAGASGRRAGRQTPPVTSKSPAASSIQQISISGREREVLDLRLHRPAIAFSLRRRWHGGYLALDMCETCINVSHMTSMIQIRNVPSALHRRLKSRAALEGMSLSDYLLGEIRRVAERPTFAEEFLVGHDRLTSMEHPAMLEIGLIVGDTDHETGCPDR